MKLKSNQTLPKSIIDPQSVTVDLSGGPSVSLVHNQLILSPTDKMRGRRRVWKTLAPFRVEIRSTHLHLIVRVPAGYTTDLASLPLICQVFIGSSARYDIPAVAHDILCDEHYPPYLANSVFRILLRATGHGRIRSTVLFWGVRYLGYGSLVNRLWRKFRTPFRRRDA